MPYSLGRFRVVTHGSLGKKDIGMITRAGFLRGVTLLAAGSLAAPFARAADTVADLEGTIHGAEKVLADIRHDKAFGNARQLLRSARGVMIVPQLLKGGFIVGGEGGQGVIMVRTNAGWSQPAFYVIGAASLGLQIGAEAAEMVLFFMTEKGLQGVLRNEFKIGAQAGLTVITLGSNVEGAIGGPTPPDIVVWASASGLYGGLTIDGSIIRAEPNKDSLFYGRRVTSRDVLYGGLESPRTGTLRRELRDLA
jgi:lipid-binding SYLF domain-containing protein